MRNPFSKKTPPSPVLKTRFVVVAFGRSGSTMLVDLLRSHKDILCYHEPFNQSLPHRTLKNEDDVKALAKQIFQDGLEGGPRKRGKPSLHNGKVPAVGFKTTVSQLVTDVPGLSNWMKEEENLSIILLDRRNLVRRYLSYAFARKTGVWHLRGDTPPPTHDTIEVKPDKFRGFLDQYEDEKAQLGRLLQNSTHETIEIRYEDLVNKRRKTMKRIVRFLRVPHQRKYHEVTKKLTRGRLEDLISNYDELALTFPDELSAS